MISYIILFITIWVLCGVVSCIIYNPIQLLIAVQKKRNIEVMTEPSHYVVALLTMIILGGPFFLLCVRNIKKILEK